MKNIFLLMIPFCVAVGVPCAYAEQSLSSLVGEWVDIPGGSFSMGSNRGRSSDLDGPVHAVTVKPFRMMTHEVTFAQWDACVSAGGCSHRPNDGGWGREDHPVGNVSWDDVTQQFIPWLNQRAGQHFRLPTEAEWEYAARAGSTTQYSFGDSIDCSQARYGRGSDKDCSMTPEGSVPVKSFPPNQFGLHDMHGNMGEWVQDCGGFYDSSIDKDLAAKAEEWANCGHRMVRGGTWSTSADWARSSWRMPFPASDRLLPVGFRLAQDR